MGERMIRSHMHATCVETPCSRRLESQTQSNGSGGSGVALAEVAHRRRGSLAIADFARGAHCVCGPFGRGHRTGQHGGGARVRNARTAAVRPRVVELAVFSKLTFSD